MIFNGLHLAINMQYYVAMLLTISVFIRKGCCPVKLCGG